MCFAFWISSYYLWLLQSHLTSLSSHKMRENQCLLHGVTVRLDEILSVKCWGLRLVLNLNILNINTSYTTSINRCGADVEARVVIVEEANVFIWQIGELRNTWKWKQRYWLLLLDCWHAISHGQPFYCYEMSYWNELLDFEFNIRTEAVFGVDYS